MQRINSKYLKNNILNKYRLEKWIEEILPNIYFEK